MHNHRIIRNAWDHGDRMGLTVNDVILMYLPLFHAFGFVEGPLMSMIRGARQVLTETFDAGQCLDLIASERATIIHGFDTHYKELLDAQERSPRDVSSVRTGICGTGMSSSIPIARRARRTFGNLMTGFGMSEVGIGVTFSFLDSTEEQCVEANGYPGSGYEVRIIDPETGADQPVSVPGEILVRGYIVTRGYYKRPEETARAIDADGWFHTGDMGLMRPDGHMRFLGRYKDMLKIGGENVDPMEVEAFLMTHPAVKAASVVGLPDARLSEVAVAFVQLEAGQRAVRAGGHRALPRAGGELQDSPPRRLRRRVPDDELGQGPEGQAPRAGAAGVGLAAAPHVTDEPPLGIGHRLTDMPERAQPVWTAAQRWSRFMRAMTPRSMPLGQAASHSPWSEQPPKPSRSAAATRARRAARALGLALRQEPEVGELGAHEERGRAVGAGGDAGAAADARGGVERALGGVARRRAARWPRARCRRGPRRSRPPARRGRARRDRRPGRARPGRRRSGTARA